MAEENLVIKIGAQSKQFQQEMDKIQKRTEDLEGQLSKVFKISAVAFTAMATGVGVAVKAFYEAEKATASLTTALNNQGLSAEKLVPKYKAMASAIEAKTGVDDDQIVAAQALLQTYIGQIEITPELTTLMVDLAEKTGDVNSAADMLGRAMNGNTKLLKQYGITIDEGLSKSETMAQITEKLGGKLKGQAESANTAMGGMRGLQSAIGNLLETIGERFAPFVTSATKKLTEFINQVRNNKPLMDMITLLIKSGLIFTGLMASLSGAGLALIKLKQAFELANVALKVFGLGIKGVVGATGIGLLIIALTYLQEKFQIFDRAAVIIKAFAREITPILAGLGQIMFGIFNPRIGLKNITEGFSKIKEALARGAEESSKGMATIGVEPTATGSTGEPAATPGATMNEQAKADLEERKTIQEEMLAENEAFQSLSEDQQAGFREKNLESIKTQKQLEQEVRRDAAEKEAQDQQSAYKRYEEMRMKHGKVMADIDQFLNSKKMKTFEDSNSQLTQMTQSQNSTLKTIGKASAITQITIDTARAAMGIYTGFATTIPLVGSVLGVIGAAAAIAFGAERIGQVAAAADGGLMTGGMAGRDSIPTLTMPGELVVPTKNFEEVVTAVAAQRGAQSAEASSGVGAQQTAIAGGQTVRVEIGFNSKEAERVLTAKQVESKALGTFREDVS